MEVQIEEKIGKHRCGRKLGQKTDKTKPGYDQTNQGRKKKVEYGLLEGDKRKLCHQLRQHKGQHINIILRYKVIYNNEEYLIRKVDEMKDIFNISWAYCNKLINLFNKKNNNIELTKFEIKFLNNYPLFTHIEKLPLNKKVKSLCAITPQTDLNLKITFPSK